MDYILDGKPRRYIKYNNYWGNFEKNNTTWDWGKNLRHFKEVNIPYRKIIKSIVNHD